jgi:LysR family glycine cleavage system transcriptional activator
MRRGFPSLKALRAFEAVGRLGSFTMAGQELNVTQGAISHQIKALEECLGALLIRRQARGIELTDDGKMLMETATEAFDRLADAVHRIRETQSRQLILTVGVSPTFGQLWLARRLNRFWRRYPSIELRIHHSTKYIPHGAAQVRPPEDVDVDIRLGLGNWPSVECEFLMSSSLAPYCSPALLDGPIPLRKADDLRHQTLLHAYDSQLWREWLRAAGVDGIDVDRGPVIDDPFVLEQAAVDGRGVALCPMSLLGDHLADGRLVRPFAENPETDFAFYLVFAAGASKQPKVQAFRDFLLDEASSEARQVLQCAGITQAVA